jgi:hypothetical protein
VNLGTARVLIIVALIAAGAVVLAEGFPPESVSAGPGTPSESPSPTDQPSGTGTPTPTDAPTNGPKPNTTGVSFMTLNGTTVAGLAGAAQEVLVADGYVKAQEADNSPTQGVASTTVYYRTGAGEQQNKADAQYVAEKYFDGAQVRELSTLYDDVAPKSASIVIVVGEDYASSLAA